jgi:hypothetical protein
MKTLYARKQRQLKNINKKILKLKSTGKWETIAVEIRDKISIKVKRLINSTRFTIPSLNKLKGVCLILGSLVVGTEVYSQNFKAPIDHQTYFGIGVHTPTIPAMYKPSVVDIDDDGDLDVFYGSRDTLVFIENTGAAQSASFGESVETNPFGFVQPIGNENSVPIFVDIDNDGDYDLVVGTYGYADLYFYENTGTKEVAGFSTSTKNAFDFSPYTGSDYSTFSIDFIDLDNDGDFDLMGVDYYGDAIYYQNVGTPEVASFTTPLTNPFVFSAETPSKTDEGSVAFTDVDDGGDFDMFVGTWSNEFQYYENVGTKCSPAFTDPVTNPFGLADISFSKKNREAPAFGDMDGDGDEDMFVGYSQSPDFYYYEFEGLVGEKQECDEDVTAIATKEIGQVQFYPNPTNGSLTIENAGNYNDLKIFNEQGELVLSRSLQGVNAIDLTIDLPNGVYVLELINTDHSISRNKFIKID